MKAHANVLQTPTRGDAGSLPPVSSPRHWPPAGAWDCHFHTRHGDGEELPIASLAAARAMHAAIGVQRGVLVQTASGAGYPGLIAQLQADPILRGVALIDDSTTEAELNAMHDAGVRGIRFHFVSFLAHRRPARAVFERSVARARERGWHLELHIDPDTLLELSHVIASLELPCVIDHCAHIQPTKGVGQLVFLTLLALHKLEHCWVKLSCADRWSVEGPPHYADALPLARALLANVPQRVIWGSDWPHVSYHWPHVIRRNGISPAEPLPDSGQLMDLMFNMAGGDPSLLRQVLVDNPQRLFA